ncbi:hypothetical protein ACEWY4_025560 [Coilia grayii]|uniref:SWIM-type domain-containing protein n=1 Tax=Coilia grayii TaxID=363190 RepID=A0ABD1IZN2_9TELE
MSHTDIMLSSDVGHLEGIHKNRYLDKVKLSGFQTDPYLIPPEKFMDLTKADRLPDFTPHDLYQYVVNGISPYTGADLKAYKSLDAYQFFVAGWVTSVRYFCSDCGGNYLVMSQVHHSQALSAPKLKPWVVVKKDGTVLCGHCTCKAGLGEVCSHITALLYALESAVRHLEARSCTDGRRQWGLPQEKSGKDLFGEGSSIDFSNPAKRCSEQHPRQHPSSAGKGNVSISTEAVEQFYRDFNNAAETPSKKSGLLRILPQYCQQFQPRVLSLGLPSPLT